MDGKSCSWDELHDVGGEMWTSSPGTRAWLRDRRTHCRAPDGPLV